MIAKDHDVAAQNPEVVARIEEYLKTARTDSAQWAVRAPGPVPEKSGGRG
jgi:hypothetical protein